MKKIISTILILALFIPFVVLADTTSYEKMDIRIIFEEGKKVSEMQYSIYASTNEDEELKDRTSEFESEITYFKLLEDGTHEDVVGEYIFKKDESYGFNLDGIKPINNAKLNIDETKILINSKEQNSSDLNVELIDNALNIEFFPEIKKVEEKPKDDIEVTTTGESSTIANDIIKKDNKCVFGLSLCCSEFKGISYCVIGIIGIVCLIFIIFLFNLVVDKAEDKKYKDF